MLRPIWVSHANWNELINSIISGPFWVCSTSHKKTLKNKKSMWKLKYRELISTPEDVQSLDGELVRVGQLIGKSHFRFSLKPMPMMFLRAHQMFMKIEWYKVWWEKVNNREWIIWVLWALHHWFFHLQKALITSSH